MTLTKKHGHGKQEKKLWFICIFYKDIVETVWWNLNKYKDFQNLFFFLLQCSTLSIYLSSNDSEAMLCIHEHTVGLRFSTRWSQDFLNYVSSGNFYLFFLFMTVILSGFVMRSWTGECKIILVSGAISVLMIRLFFKLKSSGIWKHALYFMNTCQLIRMKDFSAAWLCTDEYSSVSTRCREKLVQWLRLVRVNVCRGGGVFVVSFFLLFQYITQRNSSDLV